MRAPVSFACFFRLYPLAFRIIEKIQILLTAEPWYIDDIGCIESLNGSF